MSEQVVTSRAGDRIALLALGVCALMLPLSILEVGWAPRSGTCLFVCLLGLACGAVIGPVRLPRAARWPMVTLAGLALAMSNAGLLNASLELARVHVVTWATDLAAGRVVQDPALVTFWVTLLIWWAGYSAAHGVASGGRALEALLPTMLALAINSVYAHASLIYVFVSLFGLIALMVWTAQGNRQAAWTARRMDYPELWPEWIGAGLLVACVACALALVFPLLTSRTTVEAMSRTVAWPVSRVRQAAVQLLGGANPVTHNATGPGSAASLPTSRLISDPPQLLDQVVMWVWTDEPAPLAEEIPGSRQSANKPGWRGLTYATYSGRGWSNPALSSRPLSSTLSGNLVQHFNILAAHGDTLFAANQPVSGDPGLSALYRADAETDLIGLRGAAFDYTVTSHLIVTDADALRQSPAVYPPDLALYLQLPTTLPQRVRDLAAQITAGAGTPYDKAVKIEAFLRTYRYTLDLPPLPPGRDLVDYFLFDAPGGYCDYYASAMVVMLRVTGVPARLASGYTRGAYDYARGAYRVRGADAHSWPEVYFTGIGWVEFEPTASQPPSLAGQRAPQAGISAGQVRAAQIQRQRSTTLAWSAAGLALLMVAIVVFLTRRERQLASLPAGEAIPLLYQRLRKRGAWLGLDVRPSDTPDEFIAAFNRQVERRAARRSRWQAQAQAVQQAASHIGELYRRTSYGPQAPGAKEARQAWAAWRVLRLWTWLLRAVI